MTNYKQQQQSIYGPLSGITQESQHQKKHSPTTILIIIHSLSASSICYDPQYPTCSNCMLGNLFAQPLSTSFLVYLLVWSPPTSYSIHFFTQSVSSFRNKCPYHRKLFCYSINIISSIPSLSLNSLLGTLSFTLTLHIHLTILISAR